MKIPDFASLKGAACQFSNMRKMYPEFVEYILSNYPEDISWQEKIYWYKHNIKTHPLCPECGCRLKFQGSKYGTYCSKKCKDQSKSCVEKAKQTKLRLYGDPNYVNVTKSKETCMKKYGVEFYFQTEEQKEKSKRTRQEKHGDPNWNNMEKNKKTCLERYGVTNGGGSERALVKIRKTLLDHYGVEHALQNKEVLNKAKKTCEERFGVSNFNQSNISKDRYKDPQYVDHIISQRHATNLKKYGVPEYSQTDEFIDKYKETSLINCGEEFYTRTEEFKKRNYETKKKNHSFNTSKIEKEFKQWLDDHNINYKYQYKSQKYPYSCDFYFPDKDLYLEIQGNWTHGYHPFNEKDENDIKTLELWKSKHSKFYDNAIYTWTILDVKKREYAKNNNILVAEVFSTKLKDVIERYDSY